MPIKVVIVDDTIFYRKIIGDILSSFPDVEVVGTANNGQIAMSRIRSLHPDLITLDVEMPIQNGLEVLEDILNENLDVECLLVSSKTEQGGAITMEALALGAFDFITKPDSGSLEVNREFLTQELRTAINAFGRHIESKDKHGPKGPFRKTALKVKKVAKAPSYDRTALARSERHEKSLALAIGISTGGPNALTKMLPMLPADIGVPVFLVQHMPPMFTSSLAKNLDAKCRLTVKEAANGEAVKPNTVYIAPGGQQMKVASGVGMEKIIRVMDDPPENNCKPAVDYLFRSIAREYGSKSTCVIMTGMGNDGKLGTAVTKASGAVSIAQDEDSCVVYGMPKAIVDAKLADVIAPLENIAAEIMKTL